MKKVICKNCKGSKQYITKSGNKIKCNYCDENGERQRIDVVSWGMGTQSSAMVDMAIQGEFDIDYDYIITADTGWEPKEVYQWQDTIVPYWENKGAQILEVSKGNIFDDTMRAVETGGRSASLPFFLLDPNEPRHKNNPKMVGRQCTSEYKIEPIKRKVRDLLGYNKGQSVKHQVYMWRGITTDEIMRVKNSTDHWIEFAHPLIDKNMNRLDAIKRAKDMGKGYPPSSSCIGCPFHRDDLWQKIKDNSPEEFEEAVMLDRAIRHHPKFPGKEVYLHRSAVPLEEVEFGGNLFSGFEEECFGFCGV